MQTYTHIALAGLLGAALVPHNTTAQMACIVGGVLPDLGMTVSFILDKLKGRKAMAYQPPWVILSKEPTHSWLVSIPLFILALSLYIQDGVGYRAGSGTILFLAFTLGLISHTLLDPFTHGRPRPGSQDSTGMWPITYNLGHVFGWWDYRMGEGNVFPKLAELLINMILCMVWIYITQSAFISMLAILLAAGVLALFTIGLILDLVKSITAHEIWL